MTTAVGAEQSGRRCRLLGSGLCKAGRCMLGLAHAASIVVWSVVVTALGQWLTTWVQTFNQCMLHNVRCVPLITLTTRSMPYHIRSAHLVKHSST
jgi:hypothetical protein